MAIAPANSTKTSKLRPLLFLLLVAGALITVHYFHLEQYLEKERLRQFISSYGAWGPVIYLILWILIPAMFLPGLPLTLAGGVMFGPLWGTVYAVVGATAGGTVAFLMARYLARDWVESKLAGTRWLALDEKVSRQGWKVVAFTRIIPIFPYFILNFAFGLTRISLLAYVLATFCFIGPPIFAYVYFSANLLDLLQGEVSRELVIGIILVALVSLIPLIYKKIKAGQGERGEY